MLSNVEKAIYSYNHAIENLNAKCEEVVENLVGKDTNILDVRCIGTNSRDKYSENTDLVKLENCPTSSSKYTMGAFNYVMKTGSSSADWKDRRKIYSSLGTSSSDNKQGYWLAYREVGKGPNNSSADFSIQCIDENEDIPDHFLIDIYDDVYVNSYNFGVRPVITVTTGLFDNALGSGTSSDPYIIE